MCLGFAHFVCELFHGGVAGAAGSGVHAGTVGFEHIIVLVVGNHSGEQVKPMAISDAWNLSTTRLEVCPVRPGKPPRPDRGRSTRHDGVRPNIRTFGPLQGAVVRAHAWYKAGGGPVARGATRKVALGVTSGASLRVDGSQ